ncbi:MAG: recombinase family protein [Pseudomonadota bacterium]|nr:recombinase family protein [Pseudomonadota bacterium]
MTRAVIYARYSSDLQSDRSIEDQVALCRAYAQREGLEVTALHEDRALSGGSLLGRPGIARLLADAAAGQFEVVIVEALDRLSRDMADLATLHKRLTFAQIRIRAVHEGEVNTVLVGLRGLVGQLFREDLKAKVRRGLAGRARDGLVAGGLAYGYAPVPGKPGERTIVEAEAEIVRRIFREFAAGEAPRAIAKRLNADGIRPPQGRAWCASTLNGGPGRGGGMLRNTAYAGRLTWNRVPEVRDPETHRRVTRPTPPAERITADAPQLAILPPELWAGAQARFELMARTVPAAHRKARFLLSGLMRCAACGSGLSMCGKDKFGRPRVRCSRHRESGDCPDARTFYLDAIEAAVLAGLKRELASPAAIAEFLDAYRAERERLARGAGAELARIDRRLAEIARELDRITDCLARGIGDEARLDARAKTLAAEETRLQAEAVTLPAAPPRLELRPELLDRYLAEIARLEATLTCRLADARSPAADAIRAMIDSVTPHRIAYGRLAVDVVGSLPVLAERSANKLCGSAVGLEGLGQYAYSEARIPFSLRACA